MNRQDLELLADVVQTHFTPLAFRCSCAGSHPDCASIRKDETTQIEMALLRKVSKFISEFKGFDKRVPDAPHTKFCRENFPMLTGHPNDCILCVAYNEGFGRGMAINGTK